jgi:ABC-type uncharacterized transport system permease subunit
MREILWVVFILGAASYLAACLLFLAQARHQGGTSLGRSWAARLLGLGALAQLACLVLYSILDRRCPVLSLHSGLHIVSLVGVAAYALFRRGRRLEAVGAFVAASAALFLILARSVAPSDVQPDRSLLMAVHITSNLLGGGVLSVAGCASAFYIWNERRLRARRGLGQGPKLPSLEALDLVAHRLLWIGLPFLTVGLVSGRLVMKHFATVTPGDTIRAGLSLVSWLALMAVLVLRQISRWQGRRPAYLTLAGVLGIFVVIALYVVRAMSGDGP